MNEGDDLGRSLERLVALGQTPDVDIRPVLLRVVVDLFVRKPHHAPSAIEQFGEIVLHLLEGADLAARRIVADKLAPHPAAPLRVLLRLVSEGGPVAYPVLEHGAIGPEPIGRAAAWGAPDLAAAVARRRDLDAALVRDLVDRPEREVLLALVGNAAAPVDRPAFQALARRARGDDELGEALLARGGHPLDLAPLFMLASGRQRADIILAARREDLGPDRRRSTLRPEDRQKLAAVERAALAPGRDDFDGALATALGIPLADVWRLLDDPRGEPLALALAAVGASPELAARLFILSGPAIGQSVAAVRLLTGIVESVPKRTAGRLIAAIAGSAVADARSGPIVEPDAAARRRGEAAGSRTAHPVRDRSDEQKDRRNVAAAG